ncbi:hypothetical protein GGR50DRAFT_85648 [Xylaria sp. CBS 124048]|nr:hypothetical protein GGR50DRAFT_85648 [Xylaria sp. CBS 124048]
MSIPLPTGAIFAASSRDPTIACPGGYWLLATLASALRFAGDCQQLLTGTLLPVMLLSSFRQAALVVWRVLQQAWFTSIQTYQAATSVLCHSIRLSRQATWATWNSKQMKRLRRKIEFEFFTLILGAGGNNLCLVIFWPGWGVLALGALVASVLCAR